MFFCNVIFNEFEGVQEMEQTITNPNFLKDVESIQKNLVNMAGSVLQAHISALEAVESKSGDIF